MRRTESQVGTVLRVRTGPLPRVPEQALVGARTLETRALPGLFFGAFVTLVVVQILLAL